MENKKKRIFLRRVICLVLCLALAVSLCPNRAKALEMRAQVPFRIDDGRYTIEMKMFSDTLYCRADQLAEAAGCLWNYNEQTQIVGFYLETPVILASRGLGEYVLEDTAVWVPFFENAKDLGLYFSKVTDGTVIGRRATPLAVIFQEMDRVYRQENYRISELIFAMDFGWIIASVGARGYAILSSGLIGGFSDALSGKMEQDMYNDIFVQMLKTDEDLLGSLSDSVGDVLKDAKIINFLQKSIEEGEAIWELLEKMGFTQKEIESITWNLAQIFYGEKMLNDLSDFYAASKVVNLTKMLEVLDVICASMEADAGTIMAIQDVFGNSSSDQIRIAADRAIGARTGGNLAAAGQYSAEYILDLLMDMGVDVLDEALETYNDISSLEKVIQEVVIKTMDEMLSLSDKSDAIRYSEAYSLIQLDLAGYYYDHCDDDVPDNGYRMHAVTMLYLRTCYGAYKMFAFDDMLKDSAGLALDTLKAEIAALAKYTEEELRQNGTSDDCAWEITNLAESLMEAIEPETEPPTEPETEPTRPPVNDNSHLYQAALDEYAQLLKYGEVLNTDSGETVKATHYYLFDMNSDGVPEMIVFAMKDGIPLFTLFTYEPWCAIWIGNSVETCDLSKWYNANHTLSIYDGKYVFAHVEKSTAAYTSESTALLTFDGYGAYDVYPGSYTPATVVELVDYGSILGGIEIGSAADFLTGGTAGIPQQPGNTPGLTEDGTYHYALAEYPFYDGNLFYVNLPRERQNPQDLHPGSYSGRLARIIMEFDPAYEWYLDVYVDAVEVFAGTVDDHADGIYRMEGHTSRDNYIFIIEDDGTVAIYDSIGFLAEGPAKIQWYDFAQLELSGDCVFRDERAGTGEYGLDMSRDEAIYMIEYTNARGTDWVDVTITVEDGKITRMVLPYQP